MRTKVFLCTCSYIILTATSFRIGTNNATISPLQLTSTSLEKNLNESNHIKETIVLDNYKRHRRFIPFARPTVRTSNLNETCTDSADDFPPFFTPEENVNGGVILSIIIGIYCFTLLAIICDNYFLPCVERICEALNLSQDVTAATFMSVATSCPELFTNIIGTFITESDIGIGTIVGSSLFNALGVASIGGLAAAKPIQLDWWPVTRDVIIYVFAVSLLVIISWDNVIYWYEGLILFVVYFVYFTVMFQNVRISKFVRRVFTTNKVTDIKSPSKIIVSTVEAKSSSGKQLELPSRDDLHSGSRHSTPSHYGSYMEDSGKSSAEICRDSKDGDDQDATNEQLKSIFAMPQGKTWKKIFFVYTWPIRFVLFCTIPDPKKHPKLFPVTFVMCILWIGSNSYLISWMISIIGAVFHIPDAVLGLTFLAAGGCLPESISITIMSRRGEGSMGVSNSLGANTMNILLSLGMPWFFKTIMKGTNNNAFIEIESGSIEYTILALVAVAIILYLTLYLSKFRLSKTNGMILACTYLVCVVLAILSEMVFFKSHRMCIKL